MCNRGDLLVSYVYDEISDQDRREVEAHLAVCGDCRAEVGGLRSTRGHLALWAPPQPELGLRMIRGGAASEPVQALPRRRWAPAFAFAAAAVIVLAVAAAIANVEMRYGSDGFTVRTGWARPAAPVALADAAAAPSGILPVASTEFDAINRRLKDLERAIAQNAQPSSVQNASNTNAADAATLRQVRDLVREAESRQQVAVAKQLLQLVADLDVQRRMEFQALQRGLGQYQTLTNAEIASQRERVNELYIRANTKQER